MLSTFFKMEQVKLELDDSIDEHMQVVRVNISQPRFKLKCSQCNDVLVLQEYEDYRSFIENTDDNIGLEDCVRYESKKYNDHKNMEFNEDETQLDKYHVFFTSKQQRMNGQLIGAKLKCKLCNFNTEDSIQLKAHLKCVHGQFEFQCHVCHYSNPLEFCLKRHLSLEHPDKLEFKCSHCDYSTYKKSILRDHMNDVHLKLNNYMNHGLKNQNDKTQNGNHHATSISKQQLINDELKGYKIKCEFCDCDTENSVKLEEHMRTVHPEFDIMAALDDAENRQVKCLLCNYSSNRKANLRIHLNAVHLKLKNFKCNICDYRTSHKHSLKLHVNAVHLKAKKYKCQLCDYNTNQIIRFKFHRRSEHSQIEPFDDQYTNKIYVY